MQPSRFNALPLQGGRDLPASAIPAIQLTGPSARLDTTCWPVRGDLAHIALAGRCFVPHYAVPMPHRVRADGMVLRRTGHEAADVLAVLDRGADFDVLDIAGGWCWGQAGGTGLVGYVALDGLEVVA